VVVVLVGTESDPQDLGRQRDALIEAGAHVVRSVHEAVDAVARRLAPPASAAGVPVPLAALGPSIAVINAGLESFHDSLAAQGAAVLQMDWRPPAGGDDRMAALISRMSRGPGNGPGA
jgi:FdrA protein